jgi:hypothetical protein
MFTRKIGIESVGIYRLKTALLNGLITVEGAATYLWERMTAGYSGVMMPEKMQPEIRQVWEDLKSGKIDIGTARERARIAVPALTMRIGT